MTQVIGEVRKRDGSLDKFDINRIATAIKKAASSVGIDDIDMVKDLTIKVVSKLKELRDTPTIEEIQDVVEKVLINEGQVSLSRAYIVYRHKRGKIRDSKKSILGVYEKLKLSETALLIAKEKYLLKDNSGKIIESPEEMFRRVATFAAEVESSYNKDESFVRVLGDNFFNMMAKLQFIPAGRILAHASTKNRQLHSSFVLPVEDDLTDIFKTIAMQTTLQKFGAGVGFSFSKLRPKNSLAKTSASYAAGPVSFIDVFNASSNVIKQVSSRRAANIASLSIHHPDILDFINAKSKIKTLENFNISVEITNEFMDAVLYSKNYDLLNPVDGTIIKEVNARDVFNNIVNMAWKTGDPGILFIDEINKNNKFDSKFETTDPCGDQPLMPYEGTIYGAVNLSNFVVDGKIDYTELGKVVGLGVRFLDNCVDLSEIPYGILNKKNKDYRKISLGVMGFADMLYKLSIPYNSDDAVILAEEISKFLYDNTFSASSALAVEKGGFPKFSTSSFTEKLRNASLMAISPTGSRSILADTSPGIEPNFALGYLRKIFDGDEILFVNKIFEKMAKEKGFYSTEMIRKIAKTGTISDLKDVPKELKNIFITAHDITPVWHMKIQAAFQKNIDNAVSKTINFPEDCTVKEIEDAIILAYNLGIKGLTVYRDKSRNDQVINTIK